MHGPGTPCQRSGATRFLDSLAGQCPAHLFGLRILACQRVWNRCTEPGSGDTRRNYQTH